MPESRRFVVVALDQPNRTTEALTADLNQQLDTMAPDAAELHFIQAIAVNGATVADGTVLVFFRHYDDAKRGGRK